MLFIQLANEIAPMLDPFGDATPAMGVVRECSLEPLAEAELLKNVCAEIAVR